MIYAKDQWIQLPTRDLYDTQIMMASINAARDMYNKGQEQIKEFKKEYGDFFSPIQKDMDWYNKNIIDAAKNTINQLYDNGEDPTRTSIGRAKLMRFVNNIPTGTVNKMKQSAVTANEFLQNRSKLITSGRYDPKLDRMFGGAQLEDWSTVDDGIFNRTSPLEYKTLQEYIHPSFATIKPHLLGEKEVKSRGWKYDPKYEYTGVTKQDMEDVVRKWLPGVRNDGIYKFYRQQAVEDLARDGVVNPTQDQIDAKFVENAITADKGIMTPLSREANPFAMADYQGRISLRNSMARARTRTGKTPPEGHSHINEAYSLGLSQAAGIHPSQTVNPQALSIGLLGTQHASLNGSVKPKQFMQQGVIYDSPGTITKFFKGQAPTKNNTLPLTDTDAARMYNAEAIYNTGHGNTKQFHGGARFSKFMSKDYVYGKQPTGEIKTVLDKNGRVRTYAAFDVFYKKKKVQVGTNPDGTPKYAPGELQKAKNKYWYDLNITSNVNKIPKRTYKIENGKGSIYLDNTKVYEGMPVISRNGKTIIDPKAIPPLGAFEQEWIDVSFDNKFLPDIESQDINIGQSFKDKSSRTDDPARMEDPE